MCKVGAPDDIDRILPSATPGIPLTTVHHLPTLLPTRVDNHYFALDKQHPAFERMLAAHSCCFYVPILLPDIQLEFYALTSL